MPPITSTPHISNFFCIDISFLNNSNTPTNSTAYNIPDLAPNAAISIIPATNIIIGMNDDVFSSSIFFPFA